MATEAAPAGGAPAPKSEEDPFAAAFATLTAEDNKPTIAPKADPVIDAAADEEASKPGPAKVEIEGVLPDPTKVAADGTVKGAEGEAPAAGDPAKTETEEPAKATAAAPAKLTDAELLDQFRSVIAAAAPAAAAPAAAAPPVKEEAPSPITPYTEEEQALIAAYQKDWPDVFLAEQAMRKREYQAVVNHIFTTLRPVLEQLQGQTSSVLATTHAQQLLAAIPDYDDVAPKVVEWVQQQPKYLKDAFTHVVQHGDVSDVVDLVGRYRAATNTPAPKAAKAAAEEPAKVPVKVPKGLAPVGSKRTGVQADAISPDDYDAAFAAFAKVA